MNVLIVDDEVEIARHLADGLSLLGFETGVAHSAGEALSCLEANPEIRVVVTDVRMPGGDGLTLAQRILGERRGLWSVRVILITGHASLDDAAAAVRTGVSDFLLKPFRLDDAARAVRTALEAAYAARAQEVHKLRGAVRIADLERARDELADRLTRAEALLRASPDIASAYRANLASEIRAISHALRTPLNYISGGTELLAMEGPDRRESALTYLRAGLREAVTAVELVEELQRAEQPLPQLPNNPSDLMSIVRSVVLELGQPYAERGTALNLLPTAALALPGMPEPVVRRILTHCLFSALDWTPKGGLVEIDARQLFEDDGCAWGVVTIACGDGGERVAPPEGLVFDDPGPPLRQTQEGLRLAIARRLAMRLGGHVTSWSPSHRTMAIRVALPG